MRKALSVLLLTTLCLVAQTYAFAQNAPGDDSGPGHRDGERGGPDGPQAREDAHRPVPHRDWHRGDRLPPDYRGPQYVVDDWRRYNLQPPPSGYQWVQVNGDFVLAAIVTGVISNILLAPHR